MNVRKGIEIISATAHERSLLTSLRRFFDNLLVRKYARNVIILDDLLTNAGQTRVITKVIDTAGAALR